MADRTVIVTGASQGIGAGLANRFLERGYNVVATSRRVSQSAEIGASDRLARVDGDIADPETAKSVVETALARFGSVDALVNNAGIFFTKPFIDYTIEDYRRLAATNLEGFLHLTQRVVRHLAGSSGSKSTCMAKWCSPVRIGSYVTPSNATHCPSSRRTRRLPSFRMTRRLR